MSCNQAYKVLIIIFQVSGGTKNCFRHAIIDSKIQWSELFESTYSVRSDFLACILHDCWPVLETLMVHGELITSWGLLLRSTEASTRVHIIYTTVDYCTWLQDTSLIRTLSIGRPKCREGFHCMHIHAHIIIITGGYYCTMHAVIWLVAYRIVVLRCLLWHCVAYCCHARDCILISDLKGYRCDPAAVLRK